jgi:hypothetical protein
VHEHTKDKLPYCPENACKSNIRVKIGYEKQLWHKIYLLWFELFLVEDLSLSSASILETTVVLQATMQYKMKRT